MDEEQVQKHVQIAYELIAPMLEHMINVSHLGPGCVLHALGMLSATLLANCEPPDEAQSDFLAMIASQVKHVRQVNLGAVN